MRYLHKSPTRRLTSPTKSPIRTDKKNYYDRICIYKSTRDMLGIMNVKSLLSYPFARGSLCSTLLVLLKLSWWALFAAFSTDITYMLQSSNIFGNIILFSIASFEILAPIFTDSKSHFSVSFLTIFFFTFVPVLASVVMKHSNKF